MLSEGYDMNSCLLIFSPLSAGTTKILITYNKPLRQQAVKSSKNCYTQLLDAQKASSFLTHFFVPRQNQALQLMPSVV